MFQVFSLKSSPGLCSGDLSPTWLASYSGPLPPTLTKFCPPQSVPHPSCSISCQPSFGRTKNQDDLIIPTSDSVGNENLDPESILEGT